jgi:hypothetical protein
MAISTYTELQSAVSNWLGGRADLTSRIPEFITLCEAKLNRTLFVPQMETRSTTTCDTSDDEPEFISLPTDFQTMRRVRLSSVTGKPRLSFMSQTQLDDYRYSTDNVTDQPVYFAIMGSEMELAPTPNQNYTLEMVYRKNIPALASNATNWLLTLAPDIYLYGTLLEVMPFIKDDQRIAVWATGFATAIDQLNDLGFKQSFDSGPSTISLPGVTP